MPGVRRGEPLADEDMAEVPAACGALDLNTTAVRIGYSPDRPFDLLVERWPAAAGMELWIGDIDGCFAPSAEVSALDKEVVELAGERRLGPLVDYYPRLGRGELVHGRHRLIPPIT